MIVLHLIRPWNKWTGPLETVQPLQCPLPHYKTPAQPKQCVCALPYIMCPSEVCVLRLTWQTGLTGPIISLIFTARERTARAERARGQTAKRKEEDKPEHGCLSSPCHR